MHLIIHCRIVSCFEIKTNFNFNTTKKYDLDQYTGPIQPPAPLFGGLMTGATYYMRAGPRVAALAGTIGMGAVGATFGLYSVLGVPYGSKGWMWF